MQGGAQRYSHNPHIDVERGSLIVFADMGTTLDRLGVGDAHSSGRSFCRLPMADIIDSET